VPVRMRLKRFGSKGNPHYRIVLADARTPRDGATIEEIGFYNPRQDPPEVRISQDRAIYWLLSGAQPTDTVRSLLRRAGILAQLAEVRRQKAKASSPISTNVQNTTASPTSNGEAVSGGQTDLESATT
jgi:small subunit ribosomal protein S16